MKKPKNIDNRLELLEEKENLKRPPRNIIYTAVWGSSDDDTPPGEYVAEWGDDGEPKKIVIKTKWPKGKHVKLRSDSDDEPEQDKE